MSTEGEKSIPKGRLGRLTMLGGLAGGLAADLAGAAARTAAGSARDLAKQQFHAQAAKKLAQSLGRMKGLPMKVGQMLSYIDDYIPDEYRHVYRDALRELQVKSRPMRWKEIEAVVEADLGKKPDQLFARFERTPIAAASIGQVYRAELADGTPVAVKVQYPGIADAIRADLENIKMIENALAMILAKVDLERTLDDLTSRVLEECDYGCELNNQEELRVSWAGDDEVIIPRPIPSLSSDHVLVTEFIEGQTFDQMLGSATPEERNAYARTKYRFTFRSLYVFGMFNADPHPGNYVYPGGGKVAFLDFGCVQRYPRHAILALQRIRRLAVEGVRGPVFRQAMIDAYGLPRDFDEEEWGFVEPYVLVCLAPVLHDRDFKFDRGYTGVLADKTLEGGFMGARKAFKRGVWETKTPGLVFLHRIQFGLNSVLAQLGAEANFYRVLDSVDRELDALAVS